MEPSEKDLKIFLNFRRLKEIKRCNNFPVTNSEDVAQHSYYVTLLALTLATEYNYGVGSHNMEYHPYDDENRIETVDVNLVIRKSLSHDLEEAFTSDIPWNVKHSSEEVHSVIEKVIQDKMDKVYSGCFTMEMFHKYGVECKQGLEGQFVDLADMLELGIYAFEEYAKGNVYLKPMLSKCIKLIREFSIYDALDKFSPMFQSLMRVITSEFLNTEKLLDMD